MKLPAFNILSGLRMKRSAFLVGAACAALGLAAPLAMAQANKPIRIGVPTAMQLQVGRDTQDAIKMAIDDINGKGGVLGRKLEMVVADETENPETGISAIKKLTADEKVDVLMRWLHQRRRRWPSCRTSRPPRPSTSVSVPRRRRSRPRSRPTTTTTSTCSASARCTPATRRASSPASSRPSSRASSGISKIAIVGENAKWVQDLVPLLKKGATDAGADVRATEFFDAQTSDFSPLFSKVKDSGAQYMIVVLSHASSDIFAKQWYDSRFPMPYGGIDVKSMDGDFCERIGGKSVGEMAANFAVRAPLTPKTIPFFDEFRKRTNRAPVYTAFGANDAVYIYADAVQARQQHRARQGDQGAGKDQLRRHPRHHPVRRHPRRQAGRPGLQGTGVPDRAVARRLQARSGLPEGDAHRRVRLPGLDQEVSCVRPDALRTGN